MLSQIGKSTLFSILLGAAMAKPSIIGFSGALSRGLLTGTIVAGNLSIWYGTSAVGARLGMKQWQVNLISCILMAAYTATITYLAFSSGLLGSDPTRFLTTPIPIAIAGTLLGTVRAEVVAIPPQHFGQLFQLELLPLVRALNNEIRNVRVKCVRHLFECLKDGNIALKKYFESDDIATMSPDILYPSMRFATDRLIQSVQTDEEGDVIGFNSKEGFISLKGHDFLDLKEKLKLAHTCKMSLQNESPEMVEKVLAEKEDPAQISDFFNLTTDIANILLQRVVNSHSSNVGSADVNWSEAYSAV